MNLKRKTVSDALLGFVVANGLPPQFEGDPDRLQKAIDWYFELLQYSFTEETFWAALQIAKRTTRGKFPLVSNFYGWGDTPKREGISKREEDKLRSIYD